MNSSHRQALASCFLFKGTVLPDPMPGENASFQKGDVIYSPGDCRDSIAVVLKGKVNVYNLSCGKPALLNSIGAGGLFGAAALFDGSKSYFTTVKAASACELLFLSEKSVLKLMKEDSVVAYNYVRFLTGRIGYLNSIINALTAGSAENRLACYLLGQKEEKFTLPVSCSALADMLGIGRASLYRAFDFFEKNGTIVRSDRHIEVKRPEVLLQYNQSNHHL